MYLERYIHIASHYGLVGCPIGLWECRNKSDDKIPSFALSPGFRQVINILLLFFLHPHYEPTRQQEALSKLGRWNIMSIHLLNTDEMDE